MARGDLTDTEWRIIEGLLLTERGRKSRPTHDNQQYLNGMLHVLRVGYPNLSRSGEQALLFFQVAQ